MSCSETGTLKDGSESKEPKLVQRALKRMTLFKRGY